MKDGASTFLWFGYWCWEAFLLLFNILSSGTKAKKTSLTPLNTSTTRETMGLWIQWSLPCTTSLSCDNKIRNQTHSFQPLLSPAPFWRLKEYVSMDAACSVPACHHAWEHASADMASVLFLQPLAVWLWHLTFWICWKKTPKDSQRSQRESHWEEGKRASESSG